MRRLISWITAFGLVIGGAHAARAQSDSAIILTIPSAASAASCSTSVAHSTGVVSITLSIAPRPLSDTRLVVGTFDPTGRPQSLREVGSHLMTANLDAAVVKFDSTGTAIGGLGQHLTPADFIKDSTGKLHPKNGHVPFTPLTRAQLAQAEKVSAWLWRPECRSARPPTSETR